MGTGIFNIGLSGMNAAQQGMQVIQHNIANAGTDGYTRQSIVQTNSMAVGTGSGYFGTGTQVTTVKRQYDQFLTDQVNKAQTKLAAMEAVADQMGAVDQMLADANAGVSPALTDFFTASQQVVAYPSSIAARQSMVSSAQTLTVRMNSMANRISDLSGQTDLQLKNDAIELNSLATQLLELNRQINKAGVYNHAPNDLLDKRDKVIADMTKLADISTVTVTTDTGGDATAGYGSIQVYLGSGYMLVGDNKVNTVEAKPSSLDPTRLSLYVGADEVKVGDITGGSIGGALSFRSNVLETAENALGQVAYSLASVFNAQHGTGMDMLGNQAGDTGFVADFFSVSSTVKATASDSTAPTMQVTLADPVLTSEGAGGYFETALTKSNYELYYDGASYTLTRTTDGETWTGGTLAAVNDALTNTSNAQYVGQQGFTLDASVTGIPSGNTYLIRPAADAAKQISVNSQIAGDVRLIAAGMAVTAKVPSSNQGSMTATVTRMIDGYSNQAPPTVTYNSTGNNLTFAAPGASTFPAYPVKVTLQDGTVSSYASGAVPFVAGARYNTGGVVFTLTGTPSNGDVITLERNDGATIGVSDSSNIVMLGAIQSQKVLDGANTIGGSYAQMVADVGNQSAAYSVTMDSQQSLLDMAIASRDSYSGVNLDEEAANLLYFQQLYQANAKALQAGQKVFDTLLSIFS